LVNRRAEADCRCTVKLPGKGLVENIDMFTGAFGTVDASQEGTFQVFNWDFAAAGSALFFIHDDETRTADAPRTTVPLLSSSLANAASLSTDGWVITKSSPNLYPLERCEYRIDDGEWVDDDVSVIHDTLLKQKRCCKLDMRFHFDCEEILPLQLGVETPEKFTFKLNGQSFVPALTNDYLFERSIQLVTMPTIRKGHNELQLTMDYYQSPEVFALIERARKFETEFNMRYFDSEVENIFLVGNFAVKGTSRQQILNTAPCSPWQNCYNMAVPTELWKAPFRIIPAQNAVNIADLLADGYPFFAGKMTLKKDFTLTQEQLQNCRAISLPAVGVNSVAVTLNGVSLGSLFWSPYTLAIPDGLLKPGNNVLEIELTTSLRNMFGPFHSVNGDSPSVSILSFNKIANVIDWPAPDYQPDYCLAQQGIKSICLGKA